VILCPTCAKENQDHYKFCLGCGSDLPRAAADDKPLATTTPPAGVAAVQMEHLAPKAAPAPAPAPKAAPAPAPQPQAGPAPAPAPQPAAPAPKPQPVAAAAPAPAPQPQAAAPDPGVCTNCGTRIQPGFAFCGACGTPVPGAAPAAPPVGGFAKDSARLVLILPDGTEGGTVEIPTSEVAVGRDAGGFFEQDAYLSPRHAVFKSNRGESVTVRDESSLNGVYVKVVPQNPLEIRSGDVFRIGQELILFEAVDRGAPTADGTEKMGSPIEGLWGRLSLIVGKGRLGNSFPIGGDGVILGRERGNILFPEDGYVSGVHLRVYREGKKYFILDLGSSNGTYSKVNGRTNVKAGDFLLMGAQLFRVDI
jgi:pSer/pThr/pTyr-binding forkhead associated (FHA) protein